MENVKKLADAIKNSDNIVFFGGAGVSTESGLLDYRSEDGIYKSVKTYGCPPEEILSHNFFFNHTETFYKFYREFFMGNVEPNDAHKALARLEKAGKLRAVITQNIDNLHQKAGSVKVLELHGTTEKYYCISCGEDHTKEHLRACDGVPKCSKCGGILKPKVVLYGEMLNDRVTQEAIDAIEKAEVLIIGGTSLAVYPAAGFVNVFGGKTLVLINKGETSVDNRAHIVIRDSIGKVLKAAVDEALKGK